ncbi:hypothetical protein A2U01_0092482, partial [Trifolium medium]|nr:hypothetical protein [Trifolium medium]
MSSNILLNQSDCWVAKPAAKYSASAEDCAIVSCFFEHQEITSEP